MLWAVQCPGEREQRPAGLEKYDLSFVCFLRGEGAQINRIGTKMQNQQSSIIICGHSEKCPEEYGDCRCPWGGDALFVLPREGVCVSFSNFGACSEGALGAFASDRLVTHVIVGPCDNQRL